MAGWGGKRLQEVGGWPAPFPIGIEGLIKSMKARGREAAVYRDGAG